MPFFKEPTGYSKTVLSDLEGAWSILRAKVVEQHPFQGSDKLLFHIDEAMSWESVRDLKHMKDILMVIRNIAAQNNAPEEITAWLNDVNDRLDSTLIALKDGLIP